MSFLERGARGSQGFCTGFSAWNLRLCICPRRRAQAIGQHTVERSAELPRGLASWQAGRSENLFRIHCVSENQDCPLKRL